MARDQDPPNDNPGTGSPGDSGYIPPTGSNSKISIVLTSSQISITADQIAAAGGPWPSFSVKVTPVNNAGVGTSQTVAYPPT